MKKQVRFPELRSDEVEFGDLFGELDMAEVSGTVNALMKIGSVARGAAFMATAGQIYIDAVRSLDSDLAEWIRDGFAFSGADDESNDPDTWKTRLTDRERWLLAAIRHSLHESVADGCRYTRGLSAADGAAIERVVYARRPRVPPGNMREPRRGRRIQARRGVHPRG